MAVSGSASAAQKFKQLDVKSPGSGELIGTLEVHSAAEVEARVARARRDFEV